MSQVKGTDTLGGHRMNPGGIPSQEFMSWARCHQLGITFPGFTVLLTFSTTFELLTYPCVCAYL